MKVDTDICCEEISLFLKVLFGADGSYLADLPLEKGYISHQEEILLFGEATVI